MTTDEHNIELTDADLVGGLWPKLRTHLQARLDLHRRRNDDDLDPIQTADTRGRIAELKRIIALGDKE